MGLFYSKEEKIEINEGFIKIPYTLHQKNYYMLVPLTEEQKYMTTLLKNTSVSDTDIYVNPILECKVVSKKQIIDITPELELYMGPDQLYKKHKDFIRIIDILPHKYKDGFEGIHIINSEMESRCYTDLHDLIFME